MHRATVHSRCAYSAQGVFQCGSSSSSSFSSTSSGDATKKPKVEKFYAGPGECLNAGQSVKAGGWNVALCNQYCATSTNDAMKAKNMKTPYFDSIKKTCDCCTGSTSPVVAAAASPAVATDCPVLQNQVRNPTQPTCREACDAATAAASCMCPGLPNESMKSGKCMYVASKPTDSTGTCYCNVNAV